MFPLNEKFPLNVDVDLRRDLVINIRTTLLEHEQKLQDALQDRFRALNDDFKGGIANFRHELEFNLLQPINLDERNIYVPAQKFSTTQKATAVFVTAIVIGVGLWLGS